MPQPLSGMVNDREEAALNDGPPNWPEAPRVSAMRHGVTGMNRRPAPDCCALTGGRCPGGSPVWATDGVWVALKFALADPHSYVPGYQGANTGSDSKFTASAFGNLNCNSILSEFRRDGYITTAGDVAGQTQPIVINELE